jgi:hypothetical protein
VTVAVLAQGQEVLQEQVESKKNGAIDKNFWEHWCRIRDILMFGCVK